MEGEKGEGREEGGEGRGKGRFYTRKCTGRKEKEEKRKGGERKRKRKGREREKKGTLLYYKWEKKKEGKREWKGTSNSHVFKTNTQRQTYITFIQRFNIVKPKLNLLSNIPHPS